jgi:hypothetical protein
VDRSRLDVLVARKGIGVGSALEQQARGVGVAEEAGQPERVEPVVAERIRERGVVVEQLAQPVRRSGRRRLEHAQLGIRAEDLVGSCSVSAVESFQQL